MLLAAVNVNQTMIVDIILLALAACVSSTRVHILGNALAMMATRAPTVTKQVKLPLTRCEVRAGSLHDKCVCVCVQVTCAAKPQAAVLARMTMTARTWVVASQLESVVVANAVAFVGTPAHTAHHLVRVPAVVETDPPPACSMMM
jgi:hypothetical protein